MAKKKACRKPKHYLIRTKLSYLVHEAAKAAGVNPRTILRWIKEGSLPLIDDSIPYMINGRDLKKCCIEKINKLKCPCQPGEMYCLRCRAAKVPTDKVVALDISSYARPRILGECPSCNCKIYKFISRQNLLELPKYFRIHRNNENTLADSESPNRIVHFNSRG